MANFEKKKSKKSCALIWNDDTCDFRLSKMAAPAAILLKKVAYWSEMARNPIESDFLSSNMAAVAILWKNVKKWKKLHIDLK